ncbi:autotransporter-associated beta strand repeat-containing protein, partial [Pseudomonas syringae]|uniref:autotransporter-associated beta strand repeat-containing protein n=1 Tax=Pseudomonas syringae TaxID=317 RepID=UPI0034D3A069
GTFSNNINGDAGLTKSGKGRLVLTGNNTYTGNTVVNEGVLKVDGKVQSDTLVSNGGVLLGSGVLGNVNNSGVVSTEYGSMTTGNFK